MARRWQPRRTVVALSNCNNCHVALSLHGSLRNNTEYCVLCHNPSNTDVQPAPNAVVAPTKPAPQGINFNLLVHRIHDGVNVAANRRQALHRGRFQGKPQRLLRRALPGHEPAGDATYLQNCSMCHTNGSEQNLPVGLNPVADPQGWINSGAGLLRRLAADVTFRKPEAAHFLANTDALGESCNVCHAAGAQFAVDAVHAQ